MHPLHSHGTESDRTAYIEACETMHRLHRIRFERAHRSVPITSDEAFLQAQYQEATALYAIDDIEVEHALLWPICRRIVDGEVMTVSIQLRLMLLCGYTTVTSRLGLADEFASYTEHHLRCAFHHSTHHTTHRAIAEDEDRFDAYGKKMYALMLLDARRYRDTAPYMPFMQPVYAAAAQIAPATVSFDASPDAPSQCVLIYFAGGIGDKVMFARFVVPFAVTFPQHRYVILVDDNLLWMVEQVWRSQSNVRLLPYSQRAAIPAFHRHLNINTLHAYLGVTYETLPNSPYLRTITTSDQTTTFASMLHTTKRNIIIQWLGTNNEHVIDRGIPLAALEPLLTRTADQIHWIALGRDVHPSDVDLLRRWDVAVPHGDWDRGRAFYDSIGLMRRVDLVLSVDTSVLHIAGSIGVPTWGMLIVGCDWRWKSDDGADASSWYPNVRLFRQTRRRVWTDVLQRIEAALRHDVLVDV